MTEEEIKENFEKTKYLIPYIYGKLLKTHKIRRNKDDIFAEGKVGLIQAIKLYNKDAGYALSTFAYHLIKNRIVNYVKSLSTNIIKNTCSNDKNNVALSDYKAIEYFETFENHLCDREIIKNLKKKLNLIFMGMPEKDKLIFQDRMHGKSYAYIAHSLGISRQRVHERFTHTLMIVKKALVCINTDVEFPKIENYSKETTYKSALKKYLRGLNQKEVDVNTNLKIENI